MTEGNARRFARMRRRVAITAMVLGAPAATLGLASPALATEHHPKGEFAQFADCPLSNPSTSDCVFAQTEKGEFIVGKVTVPIKNTITLQGGSTKTKGRRRSSVQKTVKRCRKRGRASLAGWPVSWRATKSATSSSASRAK